MTELPIDDGTLEQWLEEFDQKRKRIRDQSKQVANYINAHDEISKWINQLEGYHLVGERLCDDVDRRDYKQIQQWLEVAWNMGFEAGRRSCD